MVCHHIHLKKWPAFACSEKRPKNKCGHLITSAYVYFFLLSSQIVVIFGGGCDDKPYSTSVFQALFSS